MPSRVTPFLFLFLICTLGRSDVGAETTISAANIEAHVRHLASDALMGRAPGTDGESQTLDYLIAQFQDIGFAPGNPNGTYLQEVPLVGITVTNSPAITLSGGRETMVLTYMSDFMAWTRRHEERVVLNEAEMVFVGYGVVAPEYEWDDYKDVDVSGKIIVMLVGDPPHPDESMFGGKAMTYYGRWTYKFEIAAEKGAAGAIVIHTTDEAGYGWEVVSNSWSGEDFDIVRADDGASRCVMESWITEDAARSLFEASGRSFYRARDEALSSDFRPYSMALSGSVEIHNKFRRVTSHNVVARLEGADPDHSDEHVMYSAHWDHLGVGNPVDGDSIYNGALDNASGVGGLLEIARTFSSRRRELKRSVMFLMTTAEESGLHGANYYANNPLYPLAKALALINVDGLNIWGRTSDMVVVGHGQSDLDDYLAAALGNMDRHIIPDSEPEKGYYYRSDHFPFAKKGVPALYSDSGVMFRDRPDGWGMERRQQYNRERYHKPQDEYYQGWDLSGAVEDMEALFLVGMSICTSDRSPMWSASSEFRRAREEMLKGSR